MPALDFAFGLRGGCEAQRDAVKVKCGTQLGEGVGIVGVEEGVVVDIQNQRQAVGLEGAGQEVQVGQECFACIEAATGVVAGGVVQNVKEGLLSGIIGQPGMRTDVVLPKGTLLASKESVFAVNGVLWKI